MARRGRGRPKPTRSGAATGRYEARVFAEGLTRLLLIAAFALLACHAALSLYHHRVSELPWLLLQLFDVDQENNLPTWFSAFLLLTASALLWLFAQQRRADRDPWARHWAALALGFLLLSADEVAGVHETINSMIVMTWAIPALFVVALLGLAFVPFLLSLPRRTGLLFLLAGGAYVAGAAGIEVVGNEMVGQRLRDTLQYKMTALVEEGLEMLAVILFLHALLAHMRGAGEGPIRASVEIR